jgi:predicted nucleotidyltransferase
MLQQKLLEKVIQVLESAKIDYMVTGSVASSLQGEPRSTHDIDLVVNIRPVDVKKLTAVFRQPDFYLDEESIYEAIERKNMFNLIDVLNGDKVDFWILTNEPFDQSRFARRYSQQFLDIVFQISCPEDTIIAKLKWAKMSGGSEKQFKDALRIYEVQFGQLDLDYLESWIERLELKSFWNRLIKEAEVN